MLIHGKCHCGNMSFALTWEGAPTKIPARACTCTFCQKHGGVWTSHPASTLKVTIRDAGAVSKYSFDTGTADFHVCARCGAVPVVTSRIDGNLYAVVSVNAFEGIDPALIERATAATFDGETDESRLARRKRYWIGQVEFADERT